MADQHWADPPAFLEILLIREFSVFVVYQSPDRFASGGGSGGVHDGIQHLDAVGCQYHVDADHALRASGSADLFLFFHRFVPFVCGPGPERIWPGLCAIFCGFVVCRWLASLSRVR